MTSGGSKEGEVRLRPPSPRWGTPSEPALGRVDALMEELRLPRVVCSVLVARGMVEPDAAKTFLRPRMSDLHDPARLADGSRAALRIADAVRRDETIFVHGDYDVDGICATALLTRWLRGLGGSVVPFVPHRLRDGYDFSSSGLAAALESGAGLIVTADCGTVAHDTVGAAAEAGVDVIVTDHHTVGDTLPPAFAVVNPQRPDCPYPEKGLCGTGLAYKVAELVGRELGANVNGLSVWLDLVALATVADLVPLAGENRTLVHYGLRRFASTQLAGITALLRVAEVDAQQVTAGELGFRVAPRINAAGRIGDSSDALALLMTDDEATASRLASQLDATNTARRDEDRRTLDEAVAQLENTYDSENDFGVVLAGEGWHPGIIGIVASRVVERVHRPVVMIALGDEGGRGSARSIPGFHLYEALVDCSAHLDRFGGHKQAAGMDIQREAVPAFREAFNAAARARLTPDDLHPTLRSDVVLELSDVDLQLVHWLGYLGPHGMGNPGPVFLARSVVLDAPRIVGTNHLKVTLRQGQARLEAIGFGLGERFGPANLGPEPHDVLFRLERNEYRGRATPQAKLADLRLAVSES